MLPKSINTTTLTLKVIKVSEFADAKPIDLEFIANCIKEATDMEVDPTYDPITKETGLVIYEEEVL